MNSNLRTGRSAALGALVLSWCLQASQAATITPVQIAHNCQCLAKGRRFEQGEIACVDGHRLQCAMSQNVSSWNPLPGSCHPAEVSEGSPLWKWQGLPLGVTVETTLPFVRPIMLPFTPM